MPSLPPAQADVPTPCLVGIHGYLGPFPRWTFFHSYRDDVRGTYALRVRMRVGARVACAKTRRKMAPKPPSATDPDSERQRKQRGGSFGDGDL